MSQMEKHLSKKRSSYPISNTSFRVKVGEAHPSPTSSTIGKTIIEEYLRQNENRKSKNTLRLDRYFLEKLIAYTPDIQIKNSDVEKFVQYLTKTYSLTTVNMAIRHLKSIFIWLTEHDYIKTNPFSEIKEFKIPEKLPKYLTDSEVEKLLKTASWKPHTHMIFALGLFAGLRRNEILNAKWQWINFDKGIIIVKPDNIFTTKNKRARTIPLSSKLSDLLLTYKNGQPEDSYIIKPEAKNRGQYRYNLKTAFNTVCRKAGLPYVTPHVLRHTFASRLAIKGISLYKISKWLGHSDLKTTEIYAHLQGADRDIEVL